MSIGFGKGPTRPVAGSESTWAGGLGAAFQTLADERPTPEENVERVEKSGSQFDRQLMAFAQERGLWIGGDWRTHALEVVASEHPAFRKPKRKGRKPTAKVGGLGAWLGIAQANEHDARIVEEIDAINDERTASGKKLLTSKRVAIYLSENEFPRLSPATWENRLSDARKALDKPVRKRGGAAGHEE